MALPNGDTISSSSAGDLWLPHLPVPLTAHIFPDASLDTSLVSISELCNNGCIATFTNEDMHVTKDGLTVLHHRKDKSDHLWNVQLPSPTAATSASAILRSDTDASFATFIHTTLGSPALSTLLRAVRKGYLSSYPRLTATMVTSYLSLTAATARGHLDQHRQGLDSTSLDDHPDDSDEADHPPLPRGTVFTKTLSLSQTAHSDLTGRFPVKALSGAEYVFISVLDGYIHCEAIPSRHQSNYVNAYKNTLAFWDKVGHKPLFQRLDNETSLALEMYAAKNNVSIQYCPPGQHRSLKAERAIRTFKNHFIATLCTVSTDFPLTLWDKLLPQAELCLNHLIPYGPNPNISAYEGLHGRQFDFRAHPIAPAGTKVIIHDKPTARGTWAPHGVIGFYLGPAQQHYRCFSVWSVDTQSIRVTDTLGWIFDKVVLPNIGPHDVAIAAIKDLAAAISTLAASHPATAHLRQLHELPHTMLQDLRAFVDSFCPKTLPSPDKDDEEDDTPPATQTAIAPSEPVSLPETITTFESLQPSLQHTAAEQRVFPTDPNQETPQRPTSPERPSVLPAAQTIDPAVQSDQCITLTAGAIPPAEAIAPNLPFPVQKASLFKTRPEPPVTRSKTSAASASVVSSLNLAPDGSPLTYAKAIRGDQELHWRQAEIEEFNRLFSSNTIKPLHIREQPMHRRKDTSYYNPQIKEKEDAAGNRTYRVRGTIGGDRINYPGETSANTAAMPVVKILLQSVVSDDSNWMTLDIKDYYLNTPLSRPEYIRIQRKLIPPDTLVEHQLERFMSNNSILFEVNKGMYGLPQAGYLAQQKLIEHLRKHQYHQTDTPCLFRHSSNGTTFALVVDDFGVKYKDKEAADHLINALQEIYTIKIDWTGAKYIGFTIKFERLQKTVTLSMPAYIAKVLERFAPNLRQGAPSPSIYTPPSYGARTQSPTEDVSKTLTPGAAKRIQEIVGSLLFYARGVDVTLLPTVNLLASLQSAPTEQVEEIADRLLRYCARYPNNELVYHACDMTLFIQADASYLSRPKARSVAGGICYLGNADSPHHINGAIHAVSAIIPSVVASAAEAEYAALFLLAQDGEYLRQVLSNMGYKQSTTLILCDNQCAVGMATNSVKAKRTKSIDMRYHWIRDRVQQGHFHVQWRKGEHNLADFFTKPLPAKTHQILMPLLVHTPQSPATLLQKSSARRAAVWSNKDKSQIERVC